MGSGCFHVSFLGLLSSKGKMSKGSSDPVQAGQSSGSRSDQGSPSALAAKPSSRGGIASVARLVKLGRCKNVVVVAGAGISTASGIPDFRLVSVGFGFIGNCSLMKASPVYPKWARKNVSTSTFSELQEQVFTPTWRSTTSLTRKLFSTLTTSPTTRSLSSPWPRLCILAATDPTTYTTSSACFITKACCCECTPRTLMDWRNVSEILKGTKNCQKYRPK